MAIQIKNLHKSYRINERLVKRIVSFILRYCKRPSRIDLDIIFLTDREIRRLNKRFKGADRPTDVLSFDLSNAPAPLLGNIFISIDKASENSGIFNTTSEEELTLYIIHGILHLVGYDDETKKDRYRMEKMQKIVLGKLCKREDLSKVLTPR